MAPVNNQPPDAQTQAHQQQLAQLIAAKNQAIGPDDGALQVALAIAGVSQLVTVDASKIPLQSTPSNLFDLTFNNSNVGISDNQMPTFKANLSQLLPQIANDISQIPANAALTIGQVAEFVRVSLLAQSTANH